MARRFTGTARPAEPDNLPAGPTIADAIVAQARRGHIPRAWLGPDALSIAGRVAHEDLGLSRDESRDRWARARTQIVNIIRTLDGATLARVPEDYSPDTACHCETGPVDPDDAGACAACGYRAG